MGSTISAYLPWGQMKWRPLDEDVTFPMVIEVSKGRSVYAVRIWRVECQSCKMVYVLSYNPPEVCPYGSDHELGKIESIGRQILEGIN